MPEDTLNQPNGETGSGESSFDVGSFLQEAAAAPPAPTPTYEDNTRSGGTDIQQPTVTPPKENASEMGQLPDPNPPQETPPKRSIQEIQAFRSAQTRGRKFEGLTEDEIPLFKSMSQEAYERLYPAYLESKKQAERISELEKTSKELENRRWYEEEGAYQLHPEFKTAQEHLDNLDVEEEFWQKQLAAVENNEPWYQLNRNKDGSYVYGEQQQPSAGAKAEIIGNLAKVAQYKVTTASKLGGIKSTFADRYKTFNAGLANVDKDMFGNLKMENLPAVKADYEKWLSSIPAEFRGQLPYQMLAKAAAVIQGLTRILRSKEVEGVRKKSLSAAVVQGGPGNGAATSTGGGDAEHYDRFFSAATRRSLS